ncbi:MAG: glycosyltransferase [Planctomycetota bacterium]
MQASIVINNYNYARFLPDAIRSALRQSFDGGYEVLVVDDGSTDDSVEVARKFEPDVRVHTQPNGGQPAAFNAGVAMARGKWVVFLDADDTLLPDALSTQAKTMDDPAVVRSMGAMQVVDEAGRDLGDRVPGHQPDVSQARQAVLDHGPGAYIGPPTSGNAWRTEFLKKIAPLPTPEFRMAADGFLMDTAPCYGRVAWAGAAVAQYRMHGSSLLGASRGKVSSAGLVRVREHYRARAEFLSKTCLALGLAGDAERWLTGNWRVQLVEALLRGGPSVRAAKRLMHAVSRAGPTGARRLALRSALLCIAGCPPTVDRWVAQRVLDLGWM